jgi:hypothetical protein
LKSNPRKHLKTIIAVVIAAAAACARAPGQTRDPGYEAYLWIDAAFPLDPAHVARIKSLGITAIDAEGPAGVARAVQSGLPYYADHAVPKGFLHLRRETFDEARTLWRRDPVPANLKRPVCLRDPAALERATADLKKTLAAAGTTTPRFVSFTDEPSATRSINPIDWCRDEFCAAAFPPFLVERWGSEALAREVWGSRWKPDGAPVQVDTDEARRALFHEAAPLGLIAQWNDTRAFADAAFAGALGHLASEARRLRPGIRLAMLGVPMPSAFGGFDFEQLGPTFDVFEPYDWGAARDLVRACAPASDLYHTLTPREGGTVPLRHDLWRYFLRGDRGVILFDASGWIGTLGEIADLLSLFAGERLAPWRRGVPLRPQVAVLHGMPSTRLHWLLDTRWDGASWFNRLASYEMTESSEALNREAWASLLSDLGLAYQFVTPRQLRDGSFLDEGTSALVLPRAIAMSDSEVKAIRKCAATCLVLADCQTALFDHRLQKRDKPALDDLFGITRPKVKGVDEIVSREAESRPGAPFVPAEPFVAADGATATLSVGTSPLALVRGVGANRTVYLNLRIGSYVKNRLADPEAAEKLRAILRPLFIAGRVRPRFDVTQIDAGPRWPFAVHARKDGADLLIAVELAATTGSRPIDWSLGAAAAHPRVRVTLPGTFQVADLLTGDTLGPQNSVETEVSATRPAMFRLAP